jgi:hypothetical protein
MVPSFSAVVVARVSPTTSVEARRWRPADGKLESGGSRRERRHEMTRYLISFPSGAMDHIPAEELAAVGEAAHAVVEEAMDAGVWVFGGGLAENVDPVMVAGDGTITDGTYPETTELNGGFTVLDLPSREEALAWAGKIASACRCPQEVREFMPDPAVGN